MATTSSISVLLSSFASRQNSAFVDYHEFSDFLKRYSEHHVEEQPDLVSYLGDPVPALQKELDKLLETKQILIINNTPDKESIIVIQYYIDRVASQYRDILKNPALPFPTEQDLPKRVPNEILTRQQAVDIIFSLLEKQDLSEKYLYSIILPHDIPPILFPSTTPITTLLDACILKLRTMLHKEEYHDYFLKKLCISNPGKEISSKNFFTSFVQRTDSALEQLRNAGDTFYFWSQLCFFIRQDYEKVKDMTQEDISILQAVSVTEIATSFFKNRAQQNAQRDAALQLLEQTLNKPPYYFTFDAISRFTDTRGVPLIGQYSENDLKNFLHMKTTEMTNNELPVLLVFKTESGQHYFIDKSKVIVLIVRLCTDARITVRDTITKHWNEVLKNFDTLPEMHDQKIFEHRLENEIHTTSPILHALLSAPFLPLIHYETQADTELSTDKISLFSNGKMIPYSEILLMNRQELLTDAKILLPFWYTVPVISWIARLLLHKPKSKQKKTISQSEQYHAEEELNHKKDTELAARVQNPTVSRKVALREAARNLETQLVPSNSTLNRELSSYLHEWNRLIGRDTSNNLTEDVNSLIRDYIRKVLRTIKSSGFTADRIHELSETLAKTPSMQKIKNQDALTMYIELYIVKLVKNIPI